VYLQILCTSATLRLQQQQIKAWASFANLSKKAKSATVPNKNFQGQSSKGQI